MDRVARLVTGLRSCLIQMRRPFALVGAAHREHVRAFRPPLLLGFGYKDVEEND